MIFLISSAKPSQIGTYGSATSFARSIAEPTEQISAATTASICWPKNAILLKCPLLKARRGAPKPLEREPHSAAQLSHEHQSLMLKLQAAMQLFAVAYSSVSQRALSATCLTVIEAFGGAYDTFAADYNRCYKPISYRQQNLHTPKIHCFVPDVLLWIHHDNSTVAAESEQGFEAIRYHFRSFLSNYSVPQSVFVRQEDPIAPP